MPLNERVRAVVPAEVGQRLAVVEGVMGRPVRFAVDPTLGGVAHGVARPDGTIGLSQAVVDEVLPDVAIVSAATLGVIGEEIMHLWRRAEGFPQIEPLDAAWDDGYYYPLVGLGGFFDEHAFFPFLEGLGHDPRSFLTQRVEQYETALPPVRRRIEGLAETTRWRVELAVLFVQVSLMAPASPAKTRVLTTFRDADLAPYGVLGAALVNEIEGAAAEDAAHVSARMDACLRLLRVPNGAARSVVSVFPQ